MYSHTWLTYGHCGGWASTTSVDVGTTGQTRQGENIKCLLQAVALNL